MTFQTSRPGTSSGSRNRTKVALSAAIAAAAIITLLEAPSAQADRPTDLRSSTSVSTPLDIERVVTTLKQERVLNLIAHAWELGVFR